MAKKYELVEMNGNYGLITDEKAISSNTNLSFHPILRNDDDGQITLMKKEGPCLYNEYIATKEPFVDSKDYIDITGTTHYLGHKLSLEQYISMDKTELDKIYDKFLSKHDINDTNFGKTSSGRFRLFGLRIFKTYEKANELNDKMRQHELDTMEEQFPGSKATYEYAKAKAEASIDSAMKKYGDYLEKKEEIKKAPTVTKPSLDSMISAASIKQKNMILNSKANEKGVGHKVISSYERGI